MKKILILVVIIGSLLCINFDIDAQCAMCRSAVKSTMSNGRNLSAVGLNTGILYLLAAPYLLVVVVGYLWYRSSKKIRNERIAIESRLKEILKP